MENKNDLLPETRAPTDELQFNLDKSKSFEDQAKDIATMVATQKAFEDEGLIDDLASTKKRELTEAARKSLKHEQAKSKDAEKAYQASLFGIYDGLAEYMGLKRDLPELMIKILMFIMQPILGLIMLIIGLIAGAINIVMDAVNAIVERFAKLADGAKKIIKSLFWISLTMLILLVVYEILKRFGINPF